MIQPINSVNFKGYKNLISASYSTNDACIMYLAMQLDNEGKSHDLDELLKIKQILYPEYKTADDIFTVTYARYGKQPSKLFFDDFIVNSDKELEHFREISNKKDFHDFEEIVLKIYTFIARMTKQVKLCSPTRDSSQLGKELVMSKYEKILRILTDNTIDVRGLTHPKQNYDNFATRIAASLNAGIHKRMLRYFR